MSSLTCLDCEINFSKKSNLKFHVKRKHPDKLDVLFPKPAMSSIACLECKINFSRNSNLRLHVRRKHPDKLDVLCPEKNYPFTCTECNKRFTKKFNLRAHERIHHPDSCGVQLKKINPLKCTLCQYTDNDKSNMINHFMEIHDIQIVIEKCEFIGFDEFVSWKNNMEKETLSSFVKKHGSYRKRTIYSCHRSGLVKLRGTGKRKLKVQGSNKINGFCPASLTVIVSENGKYEVTFVRTHVGHEQDLQHLSLTKSERSEIAKKIAANIPLHSILSEIRESVSDSQLRRLHLLKRKDLHNIKQCINLNESSVQHENIVISTDPCISEKEPSIIISEKEISVSSDELPDSELSIVEVPDEGNNINPNSGGSLRIDEPITQSNEPKDFDSFLKQRQKLAFDIVHHINSITSFEELNAVAKIIASVGPALKALRHRQNNEKTKN